MSASGEIRQPKQKRSMEKKKKIVAAGFKLFCEKGYYNTNTAEIAKEAGVSTGIVYNYFKDKKDIFLEAIKTYVQGMMDPVYELLKEIKAPYDLTELLRQYIDIFIESHYISKAAHEEMMAMSHMDEDVGQYFCDFEENTAKNIVKILKNNNIYPHNADEKIHICIGMIENLCHEIVYHKHEYMDYDIMKEEIIKSIVTMLSH